MVGDPVQHVVEQAILPDDIRVLDEYAGLQPALKRYVALKKLPRQSGGKSVINGFAVWRPTRLLGGGLSIA